MAGNRKAIVMKVKKMYSYGWPIKLLAMKLIFNILLISAMKKRIHSVSIDCVSMKKSMCPQMSDDTVLMTIRLLTDDYWLESLLWWLSILVCLCDDYNGSIVLQMTSLLRLSPVFTLYSVASCERNAREMCGWHYLADYYVWNGNSVCWLLLIILWLYLREIEAKLGWLFNPSVQKSV